MLTRRGAAWACTFTGWALAAVTLGRWTMIGTGSPVVGGGVAVVVLGAGALHAETFRLDGSLEVA